MNFTPRDYQRAIIEFIGQRDRCNVWAGMGTGKSASTLTALDLLALADTPFPALVLAPKRVASSTWPAEVRKWQHLHGLTVADWSGTRVFPHAVGADITTVNYDNVEALVAHWGDRWPYRTVIADEATRLKSFRLGGVKKDGTPKGTAGGGVRAKALGKIAHKHARRWVNLTGTPAPNGLIDLWGQQWFIDAGQRLGRTFGSFEQRWFAYQRVKDRNGKEHPKQFVLPHAQREIEERLADCTITVRASDFLDLPPLVENVIEVELPPRARRHYRELEREMFTALAGGAEVEAFNAAALTMKCLQLANGALYVDDKGSWQEVHDEKIEALRSVIEEAAGAPVLCGYVFKSDLARILKAFPFAVELKSERTLDAFREGRIALGVGHPASMGHGVDGLQNYCNTGVFFSSDWNLETRIQMIERIGPTRQVQAGKRVSCTWHSIVAKDTVDELVAARHQSKASVQDLLLNAMKGLKC